MITVFQLQRELAKVIEALTDIRHACDVLGLEFGKLDKEAQEHYENYIGVNGIAQRLRLSGEA